MVNRNERQRNERRRNERRRNERRRIKRRRWIIPSYPFLSTPTPPLPFHSLRYAHLINIQYNTPVTCRYILLIANRGSFSARRFNVATISRAAMSSGFARCVCWPLSWPMLLPSCVVIVAVQFLTTQRQVFVPSKTLLRPYLYNIHEPSTRHSIFPCLVLTR